MGHRKIWREEIQTF